MSTLQEPRSAPPEEPVATAVASLLAVAFKLQSNVGETGDLKPGLSKSVAITLPAGHYALICSLPGHYLAGQHTDFTVR